MKEENNIKVLDELNKGCLMGSEAIELVLDKATGKEFKCLLEKRRDEYQNIMEKIKKLYSKYSEEEPEEASTANKMMAWYGIQMKTITDSSTSKLAELLIEGANMGVIEGKKMINHKDVDKKVEGLVNDFIKMQEDWIKDLKDCL